ncbi:MAG TPA: hypothetical protein VGI66_03825 [Streptosporangiaceae bacterium]|jgi:hypothetical protein
MGTGRNEDSIVIAEGQPRGMAIFAVVGVAGLAGLGLLDSPRWVEQGDAAIVVLYSLVVIAVLIWGCYRARSMQFRVDDSGCHGS